MIVPYVAIERHGLGEWASFGPQSPALSRAIRLREAFICGVGFWGSLFRLPIYHPFTTHYRTNESDLDIPADSQ